MIRSAAICAVAFAAAIGISVPVNAETSANDDLPPEIVVTSPADAPIATHNTLGFQTGAEQGESDGRLDPSEPQPDTLHTFNDVPGAAMSVEHIDIIVENHELSVRSRRMDTDGVLIEADPIFTHLKGEFSIEGTIFSYKRFHDGALLSIDMSNGVVRAGERVLGALPGFKGRKAADTWLSPNAISVLTGTEVSRNEVGSWVFTLSDQLRPQFDLDLWIEGEQITNPAVEPRTVGPILLVPLEVVTEALGHTLTRESDTVVTVLRIQDSATISLDLSNGLVTVNNTPRGISPNITFADINTLLLPSTAVETLTGTHILLEPGSDRIDIDLDERLGGGVLPGERVVDEIAATGFVPEALDFSLSDRGPNNITFSSRLRGLNTQLQYDSVGGFDDPAELVPSRLTLNIQSLNGWVGSVGDANTRLRELSGSGTNRIRGVTWRKRNDSGSILAVAAGAQASGSVEVSDDASRPTFGGFAAGARLVSADQTQDIGIAGSVAPGGGSGQIVIGGQKQIARTKRGEETGLQSFFVSADTGAFFEGDDTDFGARGRAQARYNFTRQLGAQVNIDYESAAFNRPSALAAAPDLEGALGDPGASRFVGSVSTDWRAIKDWGPISGVAAGVRSSYSRQGGNTPNSSVNVSGSINGLVRPLGVNLSVDAGFTQAKSVEDGTVNSRSVSVRALKRFQYGTVRATYTNTKQGNETDQLLVTNLDVLPLRRNLGDGAFVTAGPTASVVWSPEETTARFGAVIGANSGRKLGDKLNLQARFSALQSFTPQQNGTRFFATFNAIYNLTRNLQIQSSYVETFGGRRDFSLALRGRINFNPPRRHSRTLEGRGVLKGQVFFDRNRDGVRQDDEPGLGGVGVQVSQTGIRLAADRDGNFTIQNMKEGLFRLLIDRRTLPLGLLVPSDAASRATVSEGRITTLNIPVIASGQIRGAIFIDADNSGDVDPGERRLEGTYITLRRLEGEAVPETADISQISASFGQYSFESVTPGKYELSVNHQGITYAHTVEVTEEELFAVKPFGLPPENLNGNSSAGIDYSAPVSGEA